MSGHSKWSTIKRKKGKLDAERGRMFSRLIKEITMAARQGGDEEGNPRLRAAVQAAKAANMPQANIERAIKRGTGELPGVHYEEAVYEGYGPGGVAVMIEVLTDNKKRTVAEIRHLFDRSGGNLGANGSVAWMFDQRGVVIVDRDDLGEDDVMMAVLEAGAENMESMKEGFEITTAVEDLEKVKAALQESGIPFSHAEITHVPQSTVKVTGKTAEQVLRLMETLEDHDDVQKVYANFDMDDEEMEALAA